MAQHQVDLNDEEEKIVGHFKVDRGLRNIPEAIKEIIRGYDKIKQRDQNIYKKS
jgi:hypothetical protein